MMRHYLWSAGLLWLVVGLAQAAEFVDYPEFRYISGLPGGGYGVTEAGRIGFDGALQINIPVGYTPGAGNYSFALHAGAQKAGFPSSLSGTEVNGTGTYGLGFFSHEHAFWLANMETSRDRESAYNAQLQVVPEKGNRPGIAVGVVDGFSQRASTLSRPNDADGRSFFAAATTRRYSKPDHPIYVTVGAGSGRFRNRPFAGISYGWTDRVKLIGEYDAWNVNVGAAYDAFASKDDQWHGVLLGSFVDLERFNFGFALTRTSPRE